MSVGSTCPKIEGLQMIQGDSFELPARGYVTCIECWATWCGPCRQVFPHLSQVAARHKDNLKVPDRTSLPLLGLALRV
jgi:thiol-disulfide isomerase/thioredoxin